MTQVSRPMQLLLLATVAFAAVWFVALRPKADDSGGSSEPAPAAQPADAGSKSSLPGSLGASVDKAKGAQRTSDTANSARDAAEQKATGGSTASSAPSTSSTSSGAARTTASGKARPVAARRRAAGTGASASPARVAAAVAHGQVAVVLFWDRTTSVDKAVRAELGRTGRRGRNVFVAAVPISQVSKYDTVTRGIQVLQAPTIVVIGRKRDARLLTGYVDGSEIGQAVADALAKR
jgi:hypothetical protein